MAEIDEEKLEKALINSSLMNFYYDFFRESEANKPQNMRQNPITKKELAHKWAGHVAEAYRDLYAVERSISPMDEESVEEGLAK